MFAAFSNNKKTSLTPIALSDAMSNAGKGKSLCLVGNSTAKIHPTLHELAEILAQDGWKLTVLDLACKEGLNTANYFKKSLCDYVKLEGAFDEDNWFTPMQSLSAYTWLRNRHFDLVVFHHGFGAGYFSAVARHLGLAFPTMPIVIFAESPCVYLHEANQYFFHQPRTELEIDYFERQAVAHADGVLTTNGGVLNWMAATQWKLPKSARRSAVLGEDKGQPWGQWLSKLCDTARKKPLAPANAAAVPSLSICLATYNDHDALFLTLESLQNQTVKSFEVVIIDNSDDLETAALRKKMAKLFTARKWVWHTAATINQTDALNKAAALAHGSYLFFLDGRDVLLPDCVELMQRAIAHDDSILISIPGLDPRCGLIWPLALLPARRSSLFKTLAVARVPTGDALIPNLFFNGFALCTSIIQRRLFKNLGGFTSRTDFNFSYWELMTKASAAGASIKVLPEVLSCIRIATPYLEQKKENFYPDTIALCRLFKNLPDAQLQMALFSLRSVYAPHDCKSYGQFLDAPEIDPNAPIKTKPYFERKLHRLFVASPRTGTQAVTPEIKVACCFSEQFFLPACVMLASLVSNSSESLEIFLLTEIEERKIAQIKSIIAHFGGGRLHMLKVVKPETPTDFALNEMNGQKTAASYVRIFIQNLLPDLDRVIYLDSDVIVRADIANLWDINLEGAIVAAVPEVVTLMLDKFNKKFGKTYFNAGVMVMDLAAWRQNNITSEAVKLIETYRTNPSRYQFWEQSPLNQAIANRYLRLPPEWNMSIYHKEDHYGFFNLSRTEMHKMITGAKVFHFLGHEKPWLKEYATRSPYAHEYNVYEKTIKNFLKAGEAENVSRPYLVQKPGNNLAS